VAIIVKERDGKTQTLERMVFEGAKQENFLQADIAASPEIIPLHEVKENIKTLIVGREFDSIDVLGIDQDGEIYIFETKLYKNPTKRDVVAQALDYGASLWSRYGNGTTEAISEFWAKAEQKVRGRYGVDLEEKLRDLLSSIDGGPRTEDLADEVGSLKSRVERNLREGEFVFLVLMDKLTEEIKNHIDYLNEKSRFWVLGVELEYYEYGDVHIVVPTIYGNESTEKRSQARGRSAGAVWDDARFFAVLAANVSAGAVEACRGLLDWCRTEFGRVHWTMGGQNGSFVPDLTHGGKDYSPFLVNSAGNIQVYFDMMKRGPRPFSDMARRRELQAKLNRIPGVAIADEKLGGYPNIKLGTLSNADAAAAFKAVFHWWKEEVVKSSPSVPDQRAT
jgi:hypothetical protein